MKKLILIALLLLTCNVLKASLTAHVSIVNGSPTLLINNKPVAPMMFYGIATDLPSDANCLFAQQATFSKNAGMHMYSFPINFQGIFGPTWSSWTVLDNLLTSITNFDPKAMLIPRFYLYPSDWYMTANPDIHMEYSDGVKDRICLASQKWRDYMSSNVHDFVVHCENNFGNSIIGYHMTLMDTGEWFYERAWENVLSGYSENMRAGFANWAQNKYLTEAALRAAWNDGSATFATITLPTTFQRLSSSTAFFRNPATEMKVIDFYQFKNELVPETINLMAKKVKEVTANKLVNVFYGYTFELPGVPYSIQKTGHLAMKKLLQSPYVDCVSAPPSYLNRRSGGMCAIMSAMDSVRRAGKLWLEDDDTKTYLDTSSANEVNGRYPTLAETKWAHNNRFAHILPRRMGSVYVDVFNLGWLNSQGLWQNIAKLNSIYEGQVGSQSSWNPEVAVIIDERSPYYLACSKDLLAPLYRALRTRLYRMGVPFNAYLLSDVLDGSVTLPKVNIFLGAWYLTTVERTTLHSALSGKAAVWFHGAGYYNESGQATANIGDLTGFDVVPESNLSAQITLRSESYTDPWNDGIKGTSFKPQLFSSGSGNVFETVDQNITYDICWAVSGPANAIPLGTYTGTGYTGLAVVDNLGFKSFYCGIAGIPSHFLRNVCKNMGVHVYVDDDYVVDTDGKFFSACSPKVESQSIVLSNNSYLSCMNLGTFKTSSGGVVNDSFSTVGETRTCWIGTNSIGGFTDNIINKGLWHCDTSYLPGGYWLADVDDNSSGRTAHYPLLNYNHLYTHVTAPKLLPNSPEGGNYFRFDGIDDDIVSINAWQDESNSVSANVSVRWLDLPPLSDNYKCILLTAGWKLYLQNDGAGKGRLLFRVVNSAGTGSTDLQSSVLLNSNVWYNVNFEALNNSARVSVNNNSATTTLAGGILNTSSAVYVGSDGGSTHYFRGDIDEIRFGAVIPEPFLFVIYYLLICLRKSILL